MQINHSASVSQTSNCTTSKYVSNLRVHAQMLKTLFENYVCKLVVEFIPHMAYVVSPVFTVRLSI